MVRVHASRIVAGMADANIWGDAPAFMQPVGKSVGLMVFSAE